MGLVSCPKHCASGASFGGILAADNVQQCNPEDKNQRWLVHQEDDGELIKFQSRKDLGRCLGLANGGDDMLGAFGGDMLDRGYSTTGALEGPMFLANGKLKSTWILIFVKLEINCYAWTLALYDSFKICSKAYCINVFSFEKMLR